MNALTALSHYIRLSAQQKILLHDKQITAVMRQAEWVAFLTPIARFDRASDTLRKVCGGLALLGIPLCIVLSIFVDDSLYSPAILAIPPVLGICWWRLRRLDMPPVLDQFVLPWLTLLKEDAARDAEIEMTLDLRGPTAPQKEVEAPDIPRMARRKPGNCKDSFFRDTWLSGSASLADGNVLRWNITDFVRERVKTRRNARGKTKVKTKHKVQRRFDVQLSARKKDYLATQSRGDAAARTKITQDEKRSIIRVQSRSVLDALWIAPKLPELANTITSAYSHLSVAIPAKKEAR